MTPAGFAPAQLARVEPESTHLDHSGKVSLQSDGPCFSHDVYIYGSLSFAFATTDVVDMTNDSLRPFGKT